jgi:hypothetical protein
MAENKSLDLTSPYAPRWKPVMEATLRGDSSEKVSSLARKALLQSIRKAMNQFARSGVSIADFLAQRHSDRDLRKLLNRALNHPFAELLTSVLKANPNAVNAECVFRWERAILDQVFDQLKMQSSCGDRLPSFQDWDGLLQDVLIALCHDLEVTAINIVRDPGWRPSGRSKKGEARSDQTASLLSMSVVGAAPP